MVLVVCVVFVVGGRVVCLFACLETRERNREAEAETEEKRYKSKNVVFVLADVVVERLPIHSLIEGSGPT